MVLCTGLLGCGGGGDPTPAKQYPQTIHADGPGDVNNIFPTSTGDMWAYHVTGYETGKQPIDYRKTIKVSGTKIVNGYNAAVFVFYNGDTPTGEEYLAKTGAGVYYMGDDSGSLGMPYAIMLFPIIQNDSFLQIDQPGINYGTDLDGDGRNETLAVISKVTVANIETVTVDSGTFANCVRILTSITETLTGSRDGRQAVVAATISEWYAPGLGLVKRHTEYGAPGWSQVIDYSLSAYMVDGRKSDTTPPMIVSVQPSAGSTQKVVSTVQAVFSEDIDPATIGPTAFVITDGNSQVIPGTVSYANKAVTFTPIIQFATGVYTATISNSVKDRMANLLADSYIWSFTVDTTAPYVTATTPAHNAINVPISASLTATFSETLAGYSVDYYSFIVKDNNNQEVFGRVSFSNNMLTFTPYRDLAWGSTYTATITTAIRDSVGNPMTANYVWSFSTPRGEFLSPIIFPIGATFAEAVAIGDVNGDGRNDVVVVNSFYNSPSYDGKVLVYLQNSAGGLDPPIIYPTSGTSTNPPQTVAIGDVNDDGRDDVVIGNSGKNIEVFLQDSSGSLAQGVTYASSDSNKIRIADINNDGLLDVVGIGAGNNSVSVWHQNGNGTLNLPVSYTVTLGWWNDLAVGDVNNDGLNDIIVKSNSPNGIHILTQRQDTTFNSPTDYSVGPYAALGGVAVGDITGDNRKDVIMTYSANTPLSAVMLFSQNKDGGLSSSTTYDSYDCPEAIKISDINGDGRNDVIVSHNGWSTVGVYLQQSDGTLRSEDRYPALADNFNPQSMAVADINGDGLADIVSLGSGGFSILYHQPQQSSTKSGVRNARVTTNTSTLQFKGTGIGRFFGRK